MNIVNFQNTVDVSNNPIQVKTFQQTIGAPQDLNYQGVAMMPIARTIQSPNYVKGVRGWRIDSNGTSEFH
jgi:hypothetical protein